MLIARIVLIYKRAYLFTRKKILTKEKVMRYHGFALNKSTYLFHLYFFFKLTIPFESKVQVSALRIYSGMIFKEL